jgi:hypothetical protein
LSIWLFMWKHMSVIFCFWKKNNIPLFVYCIQYLSIHLSTLELFAILVIVSSAANEHGFTHIYLSLALSYFFHPKVALLDYLVILVFGEWVKVTLFPTETSQFYVSTYNGYGLEFSISLPIHMNNYITILVDVRYLSFICLV